MRRLLQQPLAPALRRPRRPLQPQRDRRRDGHEFLHPRHDHVAVRDAELVRGRLDGQKVWTAAGTHGADASAGGEGGDADSGRRSRGAGGDLDLSGHAVDYDFGGAGGVYVRLGFVGGTVGG